MAGELADRVSHQVPGLALRLLGATGSLALYLLVRDGLGPAALVAARFGVGLLLLALLVDLGRALAGVAPPVMGSFRPHEQRAEPLVDETYRQVHGAVRRFVDDGVFTDAYRSTLQGALAQRGVLQVHQREALEAAARAAVERAPSARHPALAVAGGLVVVLGSAAAIGVLLESQRIPLAASLLAILGVGVSALQVRPLALGDRWWTLGTGLAGALLLLVGARGLEAAHGGAWGFLQFFALALAAGTIALTVLHSFARPSWREARAQLEDELSTLRRAFVAVLLAGIVLFPFEPLLAALFQALGWGFDVPYRMAIIGYATITVFLAVELTGAWLALGQGEQKEAALRRRRIEANDALLDLLESPGPPGVEP